ncbi:MAG: hypothetical protein ACR2IJ_03715 [Fluviibacter sp.]
MKSLLICVGLMLPVTAFSQATDGWGLPAQEPSSSWGSNTDRLNPIAPRNVNKLDREQANPLNDAVVPKPTVANPFDSSGVSIGESQALTGAGVDPATGMTTPDTPRDTEN